MDRTTTEWKFSLNIRAALLAVLALGIASDSHLVAAQGPNGKMYVTNYHGDTISRANLDGTGGEDLGNLNDTLSGPAGIALELVQEPPEPVGGIAVPVDKLGLLATWMGLAGLVSLAALTVAVVRRRRQV